MYNCYKVFVHKRLFAVVHTYADAQAIVNMLRKEDIVNVEIEKAYIPNVGF